MMKKLETTLEGLYVVELQETTDDRGESVKSYCRDAFDRIGLDADWTQILRTKNTRRNTLRGMHWQAEPHPETKMIQCLRGRVYDVLVDVRPHSRTVGRWFGLELSADSPRALFVPAGLAHGYLTLEDDSELLYQIAGPYCPELQRVLRWDDPEVGIAWPEQPRCIKTSDATAPFWGQALEEIRMTEEESKTKEKRANK